MLIGGWGYYEPILIGEVASNFSPANTTTYKAYGDDPIPVRRVRWLPGRYERRVLSEGLSRLLSNRKAIITVDKEVYGSEVYRLAYGDYVFHEEARYVFRGDTYNNIATATVPAIQLISYFAAAFHAADENEIEEFAALSIEDAIETYFEGDILRSFEINFSSPGNFVLHAKRAALPLLAAVLVFVTSGTMLIRASNRGGNCELGDRGCGPRRHSRFHAGSSGKIQGYYEEYGKGAIRPASTQEPSRTGWGWAEGWGQGGPLNHDGETGWFVRNEVVY